MAILTLSLLGAFKATLGKREVHKFRTNKSQALLIYLTTEAALVKDYASHQREVLMDLLWP